MQFDIKEFYLSISKELLQKAINHASTFVRINNKEINVIMNSRKSLLFGSNNISIKKDGDPNFNLTMGSYDGTEICELVGLYILHVLGEKYRKDKISLYCDDGLACFGNINGSQTEQIRKEFISIFKAEFKLSITSETNLKIVNVLDATLNLNTGTHEPYIKPNNNLLYILISIQIIHQK